MFKQFSTKTGIMNFFRYNYILIIILILPMLLGIYKIMTCNDSIILRIISIILMIIITFFAMLVGQRRVGSKSIAQDKHPMVEFITVLIIYLALFAWIIFL